MFNEFQGWWTVISPIGYKLVEGNSGQKMLMFCKVTKQTVCELRLHGCTKKTSKEKGFNRQTPSVIAYTPLFQYSTDQKRIL